MSESTQTLEQFANRDYEWGFVTDIEADSAPPGLNEEIIRFISAKKDEPEFMLDWRLKAYRRWLTMDDPTRRKQSQRWAMVHYPDINYQDIVYYSAPKQKQLDSLDEVDPEILATYQKLGIPLEEQKMLAGVAVDAVFDSVSVATTFKDKLGRVGHRLLLHVRSHPQSPRSRAKVPRLGRALFRQFFRHPQLRGLYRRLLRVRATGRALPHGTIDVLPHQRGEHRPIRAHLGHRRRGVVCVVFRGLPPARRTGINAHGLEKHRKPKTRRLGVRSRGCFSQSACFYDPTPTRAK